MNWALACGTALTPLDLASSQQQARAVNGPLKALEPRGQFLAHLMGVASPIETR